MNRSGIIQVISFFLHLAFQLVILKNAALFHSAFCFIYVAYLLLLPVETNPLFLMLLGFVMGFVVDMFYDSLGLHALSSVLIMYLRNYWLARLTPQGGYDNSAIPGIANGMQWFLVYTVPLILVHHSVLFFTEVGGFHYFGFTTLKIILSTLFTTLVMLIVQYLFPSGKRI